MTEPDQAETVKRARRLATLCPGAGFWMLGYPVLGFLEVAVSLCALSAILLFALYPSSLTVRVGIGVAIVSMVAWAAECAILGRLQLRAHSTQPQKGLERLIRALGCVVAAGFVVVIFLNIGSLRMRGGGMTPTALPGEFLLYSKRVAYAELARGKLIAFRISSESAWGYGDAIVICRILAMPGDKLSIESGEQRYVLNGMPTVDVAPTGQYLPVIDVPFAPSTIEVPPDCYFIVQENPAASYDSRVLSWAHRSRILATRFLVFSSRGFGKALE